jgi:DNA-binding NarL/FixJ family response regulator
MRPATATKCCGSCARSEFEVLLLDLSMPGQGGMDLIKQVKGEKPKLKILVLSMHAEHQYAVRAIKAGASGYLTKDSASTQLLSAIRKVAGGGAVISAEVAEQLALAAMPHADGPPHASLSDREYQVFQLIVGGASVSDIAQQLNLSVKTGQHAQGAPDGENAARQPDRAHPLRDPAPGSSTTRPLPADRRWLG